jgi:hypothetical protein
VADGHLLGTIWEEKGIIGEKGIFALAIGVITGFLVGVLFSFPFVTAPFSWVMPDVGARSHGVGRSAGRMGEWENEREERGEEREEGKKEEFLFVMMALIPGGFRRGHRFEER